MRHRLGSPGKRAGRLLFLPDLSCHLERYLTSCVHQFGLVCQRGQCFLKNGERVKETRRRQRMKRLHSKVSARLPHIMLRVVARAQLNYVLLNFWELGLVTQVSGPVNKGQKRGVLAHGVSQNIGTPPLLCSLLHQGQLCSKGENPRSLSLGSILAFQS